MKNLRIFYWFWAIVISLSLFSGCKSGEQAATVTEPAKNQVEVTEVKPKPEALPTWANGKELGADFFHGIAKVPKTENPGNYRQLALKMARQELENAIPVPIEEGSILYPYKDNEVLMSGHRKVVRGRILLQTKFSWEPEVWENETEYWVHYQIAKSKVEQSRQFFRASVSNQINGIYSDAKGMIASARYAEALEQLLDALRNNRDQWGSVVLEETEFGNMDVSLFILNRMNEILDNLVVYAPISTVTAKQGEQTTKEPLRILLEDESKHAAVGLIVNLKGPWSDILLPGQIGREGASIKIFTAPVENGSYELIATGSIANLDPSDAVLAQLINDLRWPTTKVVLEVIP